MAKATVKPATKALDSTEVCVIIESCAKHGVTSLKWGALEISFTPSGKRPEETLANEQAGADLAIKAHQTIPDAEISDKRHAENNKDALELNEIELREEQLAELQITDPLAAEQLIRDGDLEDVNDEPTDE